MNGNFSNFTLQRGWGVEWSSSNLKVSSSIPSWIEQQSAANRCTEWMCVWLYEGKIVL